MAVETTVASIAGMKRERRMAVRVRGRWVRRKACLLYAPDRERASTASAGSPRRARAAQVPDRGARSRTGRGEARAQGPIVFHAAGNACTCARPAGAMRRDPAPGGGRVLGGGACPGAPPAREVAAGA